MKFDVDSGDPDDSENIRYRNINGKPLIVLDGVLNGLAVTPELALAMTLQLGHAYDEHVNFTELWDDTRIPRITVVGLGGFGNRVVSYLPSHAGLDGIPRYGGPEYHGLDTNYSHALNISNGFRCQEIPLVMDEGNAIRSCDGWPSRARRAIWHAFDESSALNKQLKGVDILFLVAGLGRGAGTGLSQAVACHARQAGVLTIALVTLPLSTETLKVTLKHEMRRLIQCADAVIAIAQDDAVLFHHCATISDHDVRAWVESRVAYCAAGLIQSVLIPHRKYGDIKKIRAFFSKAGKVGYVPGTVHIKAAPEQQSVIRFETQGIPSHVARVLVSIEGSTGVNLGNISEQILQRVTCPPGCLTIVKYESRGCAASRFFGAHIWWAAHS